MALVISKEIGNSGASAAYWRVAEAKLNAEHLPPAQGAEQQASDGAMAYVRFHGFKDVQARLDGKEPLVGASVAFTMPYADVEACILPAGGNLFGAFYFWAKANTEFFAGAQDHP